MTNPQTPTPAVTATAPSSPAVTDLAAELMGQLSSGRAAARATLGDAGVAFAWTDGVAPTLARFCLSAVVEGMSFNAVTIAPTATPAKAVAAGVTKPTAVAISTAAKPLAKYAGLAKLQLEDVLSADGLLAAINVTLLAQAYAAFDAALIGAVAAAGTPVPGTGTAGILAGIGSVAAAGGRPSVSVMAPTTLAELFTGLGNGFMTDPTVPIGTLFGTTVLLNPNVAADHVIVLDPAAVLVAQHRLSPAVVVDPYSGAAENTVRVVSEVLGGYAIASAQAIAVVSLTKAKAT